MKRQWEDELRVAEEAARAAGTLLLELASQERAVLSEQGRDIKLEADQHAEALIVERLQQTDLPILAEEGGELGDLSTGGPFWIVDPVDGTMNYSRDIPFCCVSIALMAGSTPLLGVIHDFNRQETFTGLAAGGAWLNEEAIHVSPVTSADRAILATGLPTYRDYSTESLEPTLALFQRFRKVRMLGSAALMLAYLAAGRVDAYVEEDIMLWDVAAGLAIVQGAGGYIALEDSRRHPWGRYVRSGACAALWSAT